MTAHLNNAPGPLALSVNDCLQFFKIQCSKESYLFDPFQSPCPFDDSKFDGVHKDHSKAKIGILTETPFLPVSSSVKRAIEIAR